MTKGLFRNYNFDLGAIDLETFLPDNLKIHLEMTKL